MVDKGFLSRCNLPKACRYSGPRPGMGKDNDPGRYVAAWKEEEVIDGEICDAFVIILRTTGCSWSRRSGCSFCGYLGDAAEAVSVNQLRTQLSRALERHDGEAYLKIYTSGSFLDPQEVPPDFQEEVLERAGEMGVRRILIETLPRFATVERVRWGLDAFDGDMGIEFALGLESADPEILRWSVNKPGKVEDFEECAKGIRDVGGRVRTYIVIKPPLLTEAEAMEDAVRSAKVASEWCDTISFNPINVQRGTVVERLWRRREYQPPWLWTVVETLRRTADLGPRVMSGPSGGGTRRGSHNCGRCDREVLEAINAFSLKNEKDVLEDLECDCRELWLDQLHVEDRVHGPFHLERKTRGI